MVSNMAYNLLYLQKCFALQATYESKLNWAIQSRLQTSPLAYQGICFQSLTEIFCLEKLAIYSLSIMQWFSWLPLSLWKAFQDGERLKPKTFKLTLRSCFNFSVFSFTSCWEMHFVFQLSGWCYFTLTLLHTMVLIIFCRKTRFIPADIFSFRRFI